MANRIDTGHLKRYATRLAQKKHHLTQALTHGFMSKNEAKIAASDLALRFSRLERLVKPLPGSQENVKALPAN